MILIGDNQHVIVITTFLPVSAETVLEIMSNTDPLSTEIV